MVKVLYIESKLKNLELINISREEIKKLPKKLFLAYTIQYKDLAIIIKKQLELNNIKITSFQQVLGCSKVNAKANEPILLIGSGRFHAINLFSQSSELFIFENNKISKIHEKEIETHKNKRKTALIKFLNANRIGILVTTKPGQENLKQAILLKQKLNKKAKQTYIFLSNNINTNQFENFNIDSWINTACPGLVYDNPSIINYNELPRL